MAPKFEENLYDSSSIEYDANENIHFILTTISDISQSEILDNVSSDTDSNNPEIEDDGNLEDKFEVPLEHNLRELLVNVTNTENLETITQLKLRVIARETALQQLSIYTPALRELILDGSFISTLRDLGCGLKHLKILRVNRCGLTCIDSVFGFETLEELYSADNEIKDLMPCAFLTNLKILDARRNNITKTNALSYLNLCMDLHHVFLEGNNNMENIQTYRCMIKSILPNLQSLDGQPFTEEELLSARNITLEETKNFQNEIENNVNHYIEVTSHHAYRSPKIRRTHTEISSSFIVHFPPRVFVDRPLIVNSSHIFMRGDQIISSLDILGNMNEDAEDEQ